MSKAVKPKPTHTRSVTRFCDEANISEADQLDLAEFIVAAHYLGAQANDEQLMDIFLDMEANIEGKDPRQKLKELMDKVDEKYGKHHGPDDHKGDETPFRDEIMKQSGDGEDAKWQDIQLGGFLNDAYEAQNLKIARNLLATTAFTINQIADITGVPLEKLEQLETAGDEIDDDEEEEETVVSDESRLVVSVETVPDNNLVATNSGNAGVTIASEQFNKSLALTNTDIQNLDALINGGEKEVANRSVDALELLKKLKMAVSLSPSGMKKMKSLRKFRTELLSMSTFSEKDKTQLATEVQITEDKDTKLPRKYRVVIHPGAMVKEKAELTSQEVGKLYIGTPVTVEEIQGRRARISEPVVGWVSLNTEGPDIRVILQKEGTHSPEMEEAMHAERARQTKILILKSVTTLSDATVERLLEKSDWNLRNAIEAFYTAKYKTLEYVLKAQQDMKTNETEESKDAVRSDSNVSLTVPKTQTSQPTQANPTGRRQSKLMFWKHWKKFTVENNGGEVSPDGDNIKNS